MNVDVSTMSVCHYIPGRFCVAAVALSLMTGTWTSPGEHSQLIVNLLIMRTCTA